MHCSNRYQAKVAQLTGARACARAQPTVETQSSFDSRGLCVLRHPSKVDQHAALVANHPGVVTGRHIECITRAILELGTVVHFHEHASFKDIAGVCRLARWRSNDGLDVFRPTPSGFEDTPANGTITDCDDLKLTLSILERARFVRLVERLAF